MEEIKTIDARGLSCPEPAMMTRQALMKLGQGKLVVLTDSTTSRNNIERTGKMSGWQVEIIQEPDQSFRIVLTK